MITLMLSGGMAGNVGATYYTMNEAGAVYDMTGDYAGGAQYRCIKSWYPE